MAATTVTITVRIPPDLYAWLKDKGITTTIIRLLEQEQESPREWTTVNQEARKK